MNEYELMNNITNLIKFVLGIQIIIIMAFILQLISNITIISQLPKIKRYTQLIYLKLYDFKEDNTEKTTNIKNDEKSYYNYKFIRNEKQNTKK